MMYKQVSIDVVLNRDRFTEAQREEIAEKILRYVQAELRDVWYVTVDTTEAGPVEAELILNVDRRDIDECYSIEVTGFPVTNTLKHDIATDIIDRYPQIKTNADDVRHQLAPLYRRFSGQVKPQDAYIEFDPENGTLEADYDHEIGAVPESVWHFRRFRIPVSRYLTGEQVAGLLEDERFLALARRVMDGYEARWDGSNMKGHLTEDARQALEEMVKMAKAVEGELQVFSPEDWIQFPGDVAGLTADMTDEEVEELARQLLEEAEARNVYIDGDLFARLIELRDMLQDD